MIEDYILSHISPEPEILSDIYRQTWRTHLYPRMCSGHLQGRIIKMLTEMIRPHRILELGTFTGYATLCFAEGMPHGAQIHTIEIDDQMEDELRQTFARSPRAADIHLHIGNALQIIPTLGANWDLVFIDANKRQYVDYYRMILPLMAPGGYIFADNTLWSDKPEDPDSNHDPQTRGIIAFNDLVAADPRVETVILPIRDGMTLIHLR